MLFAAHCLPPGTLYFRDPTCCVLCKYLNGYIHIDLVGGLVRTPAHTREANAEFRAPITRNSRPLPCQRSALKNLCAKTGRRRVRPRVGGAENAAQGRTAHRSPPTPSGRRVSRRCPPSTPHPPKWFANRSPCVVIFPILVSWTVSRPCDRGTTPAGGTPGRQGFI